MTTATATDLTRKHCVPCEGGIPALTPDQVRHFLQALPDWKLTPDGKEATIVPVGLGSASVSFVVVLNGLAVGDKIIISDMQQYEDTQRIRIK